MGYFIKKQFKVLPPAAVAIFLILLKFISVALHILPFKFFVCLALLDNHVLGT